jgi:L-histidine N-alpha-methyltransferase
LNGLGKAAERIQRARRAADEAASMAAEVRAGLTARPPWLPSKYFYDERGSRLFDEITRLPEYYLTRTERAILEATAGGIVRRYRPRELVELGSGTSGKVRLFLDAMAREGLLERVLLLDISESALAASLAGLASAYDGLAARGVVGDFQRDLALLGPGGGRILLFLASTVGNLQPSEVPAFFRSVATALAPGDVFVLGVDLVKDVAPLEAAYNDAAGVTARFNLNILQVLNDRLGADFDPSAFEHVAFYDAGREWIEMRLRAARDVRASVPGAGVRLELRRDEAIRTEISCKYTRRSLLSRLEGTGLALADWLTDPDGLFAVAVIERARGGPA